MSRPKAKVGDLSFNFLPPEQRQRVEAERQNHQVSRKLAAFAKERELEAQRGGGDPARRSKGTGARPFRLSKAELRILDLTRIIRDQFDGPATTDDADLFVRQAVPSLIHIGGGPATDGAELELQKFRARWTPGVSEADALAILHEVESDALNGRPIHISPDAAATALNITPERMWRLDLKTVNAIGINAQQRAAAYREREKARVQAKRDQAGCTRRADSKAQTKPWEALGMGRSKFYELQRAGLLPTDPELPSAARISPAGTGADSFVAIGSSEPHLARTDQSAARQTGAGPARYGRATHTHGADGLSPMSRMMDVAAGRTVALPLPGGEWSNQCDLFGQPPTLPEPFQGRVSATPSAPAALAALNGWHEGAIPAEALAVITTICHARGLRSRAALARALGIERPTWANAVWGRYGLGAEKVERVKAWIAENLREAA